MTQTPASRPKRGRSASSSVRPAHDSIRFGPAQAGPGGAYLVAWSPPAEELAQPRPSVNPGPAWNLVWDPRPFDGSGTRALGGIDGDGIDRLGTTKGSANAETTSSRRSARVSSTGDAAGTSGNLGTRRPPAPRRDSSFSFEIAKLLADNAPIGVASVVTGMSLGVLNERPVRRQFPCFQHAVLRCRVPDSAHDHVVDGNGLCCPHLEAPSPVNRAAHRIPASPAEAVEK